MSKVWGETRALLLTERMFGYAGDFWKALDSAPVATAGIPYGESLLDLIATLAGTDYKQEVFFEWMQSEAPFYLLDVSKGPFQHISLAFARAWPPPLVWIWTGSPQPAPTLETRHSGLGWHADALPGSEIYRARLGQAKSKRRVAHFVHPFVDPGTGKVRKKHTARVAIAKAFLLEAE